jgi:RNA polymerase sigma factor (sigma-70 family)
MAADSRDSGSRQSLLSDLIGRCRDHEAPAWQELVDLVTPVILSVCRRMNLSQEESLDIFGQVCYLLLGHLDSLRSSDKLFGYVASITRHEVYSHIRRGKMFVDVSRPTPAEQLVTDDTGQADIMEKADRVRILMEAMGRLSRREYELVKALFLDETEPSYQEISERLGMPVASIGPTRARALAKLKRYLQRSNKDL